MANVISEKQKVQNAVCLLRCETYDKERKKRVRFKGTGFHYGGGWIMTAAHNFQYDMNEKDETTHSILSNARFQVIFDIEGQKYVFGKQKRMAFAHHLQPGDVADDKNKDIAMVKLGKQWEYGRPQDDFSKWEIEEDKLFEQMKAHQFSLAESRSPTPNIGEPVYTAHYGGDDNEKKFEEGASKILDITSPTPHQVPMLHLEKKRGVLPAGASGCPIMIERGGKYHLVGLHFSGDDDEEDGTAEALPWNQGIQEYMQTVDCNIRRIGPKQAYSNLASRIKGSTELQEAAKKTAQGARDFLEEEAKQSRLTIYLCNGEVIKKKQSEENKKEMTHTTEVSEGAVHVPLMPGATSASPSTKQAETATDEMQKLQPEILETIKSVLDEKLDDLSAMMDKKIADLEKKFEDVQQQLSEIKALVAKA